MLFLLVEVLLLKDALLLMMTLSIYGPRCPFRALVTIDLDMMETAPPPVAPPPPGGLVVVLD